jgi:hypothetical protein
MAKKFQAKYFLIRSRISITSNLFSRLEVKKGYKQNAKIRK